MMNGPEKSDSVIVALKLTNKAERSAAELVEQRTGTKGNVGQLSTCRAQNRISVTQVLARIRQQLPSTLGGSRMRESRTCGSVRGARGNSRPYRESSHYAEEALDNKYWAGGRSSSRIYCCRTVRWHLDCV